MYLTMSVPYMSVKRRSLSTDMYGTDIVKLLTNLFITTLQTEHLTHAAFETAQLKIQIIKATNLIDYRLPEINALNNNNQSCTCNATISAQQTINTDINSTQEKSKLCQHKAVQI